MWIYDCLYYNTYLLAQKSKNFDDIPVLGGMIYVTVCLMLNIFTISLFLDGLGVKTGIEFKNEYKFIFCSILVGSLLLYYLYKGRYKKIVERYEEKEKKKKRRHPILHSIIVVIIYYGISVVLFFLAAFYRNHFWIFA